jgi:tetratricopeptide (TPR) repeat protein
MRMVGNGEYAMSPKTFVPSSLLLTVFATTACACLWDNDTLQMERLRFPGVLEIITGKFVRHSPAYYEWRIVDRQKKLAAQPDDPALIDDLAVAYAKLGRPDEGLPLLQGALEQHPNRYETLSNLGTLLFFAGRLDESKHYIRRAVEINPDAHFGRERYQLLLTEYLQQSTMDRSAVMSDESRQAPEIGSISPGFARFVQRSKFGNETSNSKKDWRERAVELQSATKGVLGMMHFANFESPILLEALGDLLMTGGTDEDAAQHAARAYLRAADLSTNDVAASRFRAMAKESLSMQQPHSLPTIKAQLEGEVADAKAWFAEIEKTEAKWIADGLDVDREFAAVYYNSLDATISSAKKELKHATDEATVEDTGEAPHGTTSTPEHSFDNSLVYYSGLVVALVLLASTFLHLRRTPLPRRATDQLPPSA